DFAVQVAADVLGMPIKVSATEEGPALGAAMCAATAAGHYATVQEAQAAMAPGFKTTHEPDLGRAAKYTEGYQRYRALAETVESAPWRPTAP
ncbi:MAG: FGGY-family carbohydrate kinase, partial [Spirochaetaceae bacterium]|nr:FGGY-family carbohydrate kinase [Spirochaetaceae bacterium]